MMVKSMLKRISDAESSGSKCEYNGKEVDCLAFATDSGGFTGKILLQVLTYFDLIDLFSEIIGSPIPVLIVDSHQSQLDPAFITSNQP